MIPFKINGSKYQIPTRWEDVTYAQYVALITLPFTIKHQISLFTGIPIDTLENAELKNLEKISIALAFLTVSPKTVDSKPTPMIGPYVPPKDVTLQSVGQFEDLRALLMKVPPDLATQEHQMQLADLYLEACAIYITKVKFSKYDNNKVPEVKEELKNYSCVEILQMGGFFLGKLANLSRGITTRSQSIFQRLKKALQDLPGYQKTLDSLLHSSTPPKA
jgi:hypothetical protein